jgi:hypothetical protein
MEPNITSAHIVSVWTWPDTKAAGKSYTAGQPGAHSQFHCSGGRQAWNLEDSKQRNLQWQAPGDHCEGVAGWKAEGDSRSSGFHHPGSEPCALFSAIRYKGEGLEVTLASVSPSPDCCQWQSPLSPLLSLIPCWWYLTQTWTSANTNQGPRPGVSQEH